MDGGGNGHQQDARRDVVEVAGPAGMPAGEPAAEAVAELAAEDVDEQQQEHQRHADHEESQRRVAHAAGAGCGVSIVTESVTV